MLKTRIVAILLVAILLVFGACAAPTTAPEAEAPSTDQTVPEAGTAPVPTIYTLSISVSPLGAGSVLPSGGQYEEGTQVTLTATTASGYTFDCWDGDASSSLATITIIMDSDKSIVAHFSVVDIAPPILSGVNVSNITETCATITWTTDEPATSQVEYGRTDAYGSASTLDQALAASHSVTLSDLEPNTVYHYRVKSRDISDNLAISADYSLTTLFLPNAQDKDQYATILKLTDSKGNCEFHSEYNGREPTYIGSNLYRLIKVGEIIVIRVDVYNEIAPPVIYEFIGEGFPNIEQLDNEVTFEVTDKLQTVHLRVFVKNSDEKYRAPYYDDMIQISYKVENS